MSRATVDTAHGVTHHFPANSTDGNLWPCYWQFLPSVGWSIVGPIKMAQVMIFLRNAALAVSLLLAFGATAWAMDGGSLNAIAFADLPAGAAMSVRARDNSNENLSLKKIFEAALTVQGYVVSADAPLIFSFETSDDIGAYSSGSQRSILEFQGSTGSAGNDEAARFRLNLFDSRRGGLFNQGRDDRTNVITPASFRIDAAINDSRGGGRLWQAWTIAIPQGGGRTTAAQDMATIIVKVIGKNVKDSSFTLP